MADGVVIGTLLGHVTGSVVTVTTAFPLPHSYVQDTVALDMEFHQVMLDQHQLAFPKEAVVGW